MKWLLRDFKKFYHKQLKASKYSEIQDDNPFEEYVRTSGVHFDDEQNNSNESSSNWLKISFYLSLVVNSSLWFSNNKFTTLLKDLDCLGKESYVLLTVNDVVFRFTIERLWRFMMPKENKILLNYFFSQMTEEYMITFAEEISIIKAIENAQN